MLLSPEQFAKLVEYASYSNHKLLDMLEEFRPDGKFYHYLASDQTIDFDGFKQFINCYFGAELPNDLVQQLFLSFGSSSADETTERKASVFEEGLNVVKNVFSHHHPFKDHHHGIGGNSSTVLSPTTVTTTPMSVNAQHFALPPYSSSMVNGGGPYFGLLNPAASAGGAASSLAPSQQQILQDKRIPLKPMICYLCLLEGAPPEDKLEFVFHVYDSDDNGYLDNKEIESIIEQMMNVAKYQQWDTIELEPILRQMMNEIDYDNDGIVSLSEWKRGGLTTIPLLVLLGFDTELKEDGTHIWRLRHFSKPTYCHVCKNLLVGWGGRQGLACSLCKYTVHERCVRSADTNCIHTYNQNPTKREPQDMLHHWMGTNTAGKCWKCREAVHIFQGEHCRWCKALLHDKCRQNWPKICDFGMVSHHILPPVNIIPTFLDRSQSQSQQPYQQNQQQQNCGTPPACYAQRTNSYSGSNLLQVLPFPPGSRCRPLLVLINPKSGGRQGERIYRKFQYLLNPRQVYDIDRDGPEPGIKNCNILVCGGDGTIGWVLECMDRIEYGEGRPPVAILPLGTGNDLARCLKWGGGYENEPLTKILQSVERSSQIFMDRWRITIEQTRKNDKGDPQPYQIINNYFTIGVDASIAHRFHIMREKYPEKFNSRMRNKLWYFELGTSETISSTCKNLHEHIDILCDGETVDLGNGPNLEGIALLNIASIYGGSNLWGTKRKSLNIPYIFPKINSSVQLQYRVQDIGDRMIEVVGLESAIQMGQIKAGVRQARRLAQCSTVVIETHKTLPMQRRLDRRRTMDTATGHNPDCPLEPGPDAYRMSQKQSDVEPAIQAKKTIEK